MIGDMWNFVNLGKRVDGCEHTLETVNIFIAIVFSSHLIQNRKKKLAFLLFATPVFPIYNSVLSARETDRRNTERNKGLELIQILSGPT